MIDKVPGPMGGQTIQQEHLSDIAAELDPGIRDAVVLLIKYGVETVQSCEGGPGHSYPEPTIEFVGDRAEGLRALAIALRHGLPVSEYRRAWHIRDGEMDGPIHALVLYKHWFVQ